MGVPVAHGANQYWSYHTLRPTRQRADNTAVHSRGLTGVGCFYIPGSYAHRSGGREASILVQGWQPTQTECPEGGSPRQSPVGPRTHKRICPVVCCRPTGRGYLPGTLWPGQHMAAGILDGRDGPMLIACTVISGNRDNHPLQASDSCLFDTINHALASVVDPYVVGPRTPAKLA